MDLKNNSITLGELLANPKAAALAKKEFPELMNPFFLRMAQNMTLKKALGYAKNQISQKKIDRVLEELKRL